MKNGIDISYCQKGLDLEAVKAAGVEFAIIRAGISTRLDTEFKTHVENAKKAQLPYGFYWYSRAFSTIEAKSEAEACINAIKDYKPTYPIFYDMEEKDQIDGLTNEQRTDIICVFCEEIKKAGYTAGVYINPSWMETYVDKSRLVGKYDIWLAHWTFAPEKPTSYDYGQVMWQWGTRRFGTAEVDANICYKDYPIVPQKGIDMNSGTSTAGSEVANDDKPKTNLKQGSEVTLKNAPLYAASTASRKANTISGTYWIHSDGIINRRIRITTPKDCKDCTGWVNVADCKTAELETTKSNEEIAQEVIAGKWGNGQERIDKLTAAGYNYNEIQKIVNDKLSTV